MSRAFLFRPQESEVSSLELFFKSFGGYTAFVKKSLQEHGYKPLPSLSEVAKRTSSANDNETEEFKGGVSDE